MRDEPDLPSWLPPLVAEHARLIYRQSRDDEEAAALLRVTVDQRMEAVWASALLATAERLASSPMPARERRKVQKALQRTAASYDTAAAAVVAETIDHLPVAVAHGIARKLSQRFVGHRTNAAGGPIGDYMPTQAAIIASVIFGQTVTASDVEYRLAVTVG